MSLPAVVEPVDLLSRFEPAVEYSEKERLLGTIDSMFADARKRYSDQVYKSLEEFILTTSYEEEYRLLGVPTCLIDGSFHKVKLDLDRLSALDPQNVFTVEFRPGEFPLKMKEVFLHLHKSCGRKTSRRKILYLTPRSFFTWLSGTGKKLVLHLGDLDRLNDEQKAMFERFLAVLHSFYTELQLSIRLSMFVTFDPGLVLREATLWKLSTEYITLDREDAMESREQLIKRSMEMFNESLSDGSRFFVDPALVYAFQREALNSKNTLESVHKLARAAVNEHFARVQSSGGDYPNDPEVVENTRKKLQDNASLLEFVEKFLPETTPSLLCQVWMNPGDLRRYLNPKTLPLTLTQLFQRLQTIDERGLFYAYARDRVENLGATRRNAAKVSRQAKIEEFFTAMSDRYAELFVPMDRLDPLAVIRPDVVLRHTKPNFRAEIRSDLETGNSLPDNDLLALIDILNALPRHGALGDLYAKFTKARKIEYDSAYSYARFVNSVMTLESVGIIKQGPSMQMKGEYSKGAFMWF